MAAPPRQHAVSHLHARGQQRAVPPGRPVPDEPCAPWLCPVGALAGQYLTAELEEVQKADFARKMSSIMGKGTVDARALDPRPVVRARLFACDAQGGNRVEIEPDPDTKELTAFNGQLICKAGLYPYNRDYERDGDTTRFASGRVTPSPLLPSSAPPQPDLASEFAYPPPTLPRRPTRPLGPECEMAFALSGMRDLRARECQAYHEPVGKVALYFVFEDLRVSEVGHFCLKYSLIFLDNAFVANPEIKPPVLAKCWGGVFAIYPSKKAPPKEKSTDFGMFLYTNNLLSRPHTEKPANKRKAAQAEKAAAHPPAAAAAASTSTSAHPSNTQAQVPAANMFHPFPPPSGLAPFDQHQPGFPNAGVGAGVGQQPFAQQQFGAGAPQQPFAPAPGMMQQPFSVGQQQQQPFSGVAQPFAVGVGQPFAAYPPPPPQQQQASTLHGGSARQPQPPSYTFPFPPGAFPHAPGRPEAEGALPRIDLDAVRRAQAGVGEVEVEDASRQGRDKVDGDGRDGRDGWDRRDRRDVRDERDVRDGRDGRRLRDDDSPRRDGRAGSYSPPRVRDASPPRTRIRAASPAARRRSDDDRSPPVSRRRDDSPRPRRREDSPRSSRRHASPPPRSSHGRHDSPPANARRRIDSPPPRSRGRDDSVSPPSRSRGSPPLSRGRYDSPPPRSRGRIDSPPPRSRGHIDSPPPPPSSSRMRVDSPPPSRDRRADSPARHRDTPPRSSRRDEYEGRRRQRDPSRHREDRSPRRADDEGRRRREDDDVHMRREDDDVRMRREDDDVRMRREDDDVRMRREDDDVRMRREDDDVRMREDGVRRRRADDSRRQRSASPASVRRSPPRRRASPDASPPRQPSPSQSARRGASPTQPACRKVTPTRRPSPPPPVQRTQPIQRAHPPQPSQRAAPPKDASTEVLEGLSLAQARHEAWLRAQYEPPAVPEIPEEVVAVLIDDAASEASGSGASADAERRGSGANGGAAKDEGQVRRRLKFDPVRDSL